MAEAIPQMIGKYKIMGLIAKGGMGAVYKSVHPSLRRPVILKKLTVRSNPTVRERFKREAQILLELQNPYIVHLFDYFIEGNSHYIVEEFVDGMSLADLIEKQVALGTQVSLLVFLDACYALKYAHAKGIVHRDIKPGNILISRRAEVKLADFGIASNDSGDDIAPSSSSSGTIADSNLTQSGVTLGTPAYMSPEQITDSRSVDKRADIYSMGVMLYEMMTGTKPYPSSLTADTLDKIRRGKYIRPRNIDKSIPHVISRMIHRMLKYNPKSRYQSIEAVIKIVKKYLSSYDTHAVRVALAQSIISKKQFSIPAFEKKRNVSRIILTSVLGAAALAGGAFWAWNSGYVHKTILSPWYTPVELKVEMPVNTSAGSDLEVRSFIFIDDGNKIPEVEGARRVFTELPESSQASSSKNKKNKILTTKTVYLRPDKYRLKLAVGPYVIWQNLIVKEEKIDILINGLKNQRRTISVNVNAYDGETEKLIPDAVYTVNYNGKWVPLEKIPQEQFKTGAVWTIRVEAKGYKSAEYTLRLDWYQDDLLIKALLEKKSK
ncbi:MAG: serine/threonine protein kinase [Treponema sp.]|nr:serine/threonine protein kinase [Treponema sp.]